MEQSSCAHPVLSRSAYPRYRLIENPQKHDDQSPHIALGVLEQLEQLKSTPESPSGSKHPTGRSLQRESDNLFKPTCSPARVGHCFCVVTVEYD
jgi:hypothetical protein